MIHFYSLACLFGNTFIDFSGAYLLFGLVLLTIYSFLFNPILQKFTSDIFQQLGQLSDKASLDVANHSFLYYRKKIANISILMYCVFSVTSLYSKIGNEQKHCKEAY